MTYENVPFKREPGVAAERKRLAAFIRDEHRKNPKLTRERYLALRRVSIAYHKAVFSTGTAPEGFTGGLQELVR